MNALIAIFTGSILGMLSLFRPDVGIRWIFATCVVVVGTVGYFFPNYSYISWGVGTSGIFLIVIALFQYISKKNAAIDPITHTFLIFTLYLIIPAVSSMYNPMEIIASTKNIIQYWGFVPLAALGFMPNNSRKKILKLIVYVVLLQAIVSFYQAFFIVDWAHRLAGGDSVVGTFGGTPDGGGSSGAQTIFLSVIISITLAVYISGHLKLLYVLGFLVTALIPISLNETKIFFVLMLILVIYVFITGFRKFPLRTMQVSIISLALTVTILIIYFLFLQHNFTGRSDKTIADYAERVTQSRSGFHLGEGREASYSRLGSIKFWWEEQTSRNNTLQMLVGHGIGASKSGGVFVGKLVQIGSPYYGLKLDVTGLSMLLWDIGIIGTVLFFNIFLAAWLLAIRTRRSLGCTALGGSIIWGIEIGIVILAITNLYDGYLFKNPALNAFTMLVFAYLVSAIKSQVSTSNEKQI
jgi:hypothetical protein